MKFATTMKTALSCAAVFFAAGICSAAEPFLTSLMLAPRTAAAANQKSDS